jgi:hypothetical protein
MKNLIEKQIKTHSKMVDLLQAIGSITHSIDAFETSNEPELYLKRLKRQRQILFDEHNKELKTIVLLDVVPDEPLKMDDLLVSDKLKKHFSPRSINGLKHLAHLIGLDPYECTVDWILKVKPERFMMIRNIGSACVRELIDFQLKMK